MIPFTPSHYFIIILFAFIKPNKSQLIYRVNDKVGQRLNYHNYITNN